MRKVFKPTLDWTVNVTRTVRKHAPIRVLLVDDSIYILQGLQAILSQYSQFMIVGTARSEADMHASIESSRPDVVVLDVQIGGVSGIHIYRDLRASHPTIAVLFFTAADEKELLHAAMQAGAQGYLLKHASSEAIVKNIEIVSCSQAVLDQ